MGRVEAQPSRFRLPSKLGSHLIHREARRQKAMRATQILVVEDEQLTRDLTLRFLANEGFEVRGAADVPSCRAAMAAASPDIVILDLGLPGQDGLVLARELRDDPTIDVIVVTMRDTPAERIVALDAGADDYLIKPVHLGELAARIRAAERRREHHRKRQYHFAGLTLDVTRRVLTTGDGALIPLTRGEFEILQALAEADGKIVSREALSQVVSRRGKDQSDLRSVDALVSRLRRKLGERTSILTAPGFGYRLSGS